VISVRIRSVFIPNYGGTLSLRWDVQSTFHETGRTDYRLVRNTSEQEKKTREQTETEKKNEHGQNTIYRPDENLFDGRNFCYYVMEK